MAEADETEPERIEITPEMIEAGGGELTLFDPDRDNGFEITSQVMEGFEDLFEDWKQTGRNSFILEAGGWET